MELEDELLFKQYNISGYTNADDTKENGPVKPVFKPVEDI